MRFSLCLCRNRKHIPDQKLIPVRGNFKPDIRIHTQNLVISYGEVFYAFRFHNRIRVHMECIAFNRNVFMNRLIGRRQAAPFRNRMHIDRRRILPASPPNAFDKKLIVFYHHIPNRTRFIPLVGIIGKKDCRHRHLFKCVAFN